MKSRCHAAAVCWSLPPSGQLPTAPFIDRRAGTWMDLDHDRLGISAVSIPPAPPQ
ncbi:MAG: hypothetical protein KDK99_14455 [Verrucomicrobiales bacterium]|nr:hypothetical protein [Verrucomicrobiales bacterium]